MPTNENQRINRVVIDYVPAQLTKGKEWYIYFYAKHPDTNKLKRIKIKVNRVKNKAERKKYADTIIDEVNYKLRNNWNPFVEAETPKAYVKLVEAINDYIRTINKHYADNIIRKNTYDGYVSFINNICIFLKEKKLESIFIYQFNKTIINKILDWIYLEKKRGAKTRDNYLTFLRVFSTFLAEKEYLKVKPTDGINIIGKKIITEKNRSVIDKNTLFNIFEYLEREDKYYLMACYFCYYGFIRPIEMSKLKIKDINLQNKTIFIENCISKNKKSQAVTIPIKLFELIKELNICSCNSEYFIFSDNFKPGMKKRAEKMFRDEWSKIREIFKFPTEYKFYSLKDTGITQLLTVIGDTRLVRDQARHYSIAMTDNYTPRAMMKGDKNISELDY